MKKDFAIITIKDGIIQNRKALKELFTVKDGKYKVELSKINKRSLNQNSYYWLMLTEYVQPGLYDQGWSHIKSKEDAHEFVADLFLKVKVVNEETGEMKERIKSTTELSKTDFNVYLEEIWQWAAEYLTITIPSPNQQMEIEL